MAKVGWFESGRRNTWLLLELGRKRRQWVKLTISAFRVQTVEIIYRHLG